MNLIEFIFRVFTPFNTFFIIVATYFITIYFYLRWLTKKYLNPVDRTHDLNLSRRYLRTNNQVRQELEDRETINILVLTGGGVRGMIPLQVLEKLEQLSGRKTGELFDFMAGTSTGAISCAILAVPGIDHQFEFCSSDILGDYAGNSRKMFSAPWYHKFLTLFGMLGPRYLPEGKLEVLRSFFGTCTLADIETNLIVPVYDVTENALKIIRNWELPQGNQHTNYVLKDLIHGASNPPMLFSPRSFIISNKKHVFIDPGVILNNPATIAFMNAWFLFPEKKLRLVLIGNGGSDAEVYNHEHMAEFGAYGLFQYLLNSPVVNTKFSTDLLHEYIHEAREYGVDIEFIQIDSRGGKDLATSDTSDENMERIREFGEKLITENYDKIEYLAEVLKIKK